MAISPQHPSRIRREIAGRYLSGSGIEIGALHLPLSVPSRIEVRYVERMPVRKLRAHYPELAEHPLVDVDIIDDGEKLSSIPAKSVDFVIANHLIEHTEDPISSISNWLRVIRPSGVLYMAVPHRMRMFDRDRPATPLEHVIRDHREGPEWPRRSHFEERVRLVGKVPEDRVPSEVKRLMELEYSIHFHVWNAAEFLELLLHCRTSLSLPFDVEMFQRNGAEFIVVMRRGE